MALQIDWNHFTPLAILAGGPAIGRFVVAMRAGLVLRDNVRARRQRKVAPA